MTAAGDPCPPNTIWFYSTEKKYGEFSNFWFPESLLLLDRQWKTTEHYFQAMKFHKSPKDFDELANLPSAMKVAKAGRERTRPLRSDWEQVKDGIMFDCCLAKFTQNPKLWEILDSTGDCHLVERTKNDNYWGDGGDGSGKNMLGITLVKVRQHVRDQQKKQGGDATQKKSAAAPTAGGGGDQVTQPPENTLWFYSTAAPYGEFANFYKCDNLVIGDSKWRTTEHYFQAMKFEHSPKDFFELAAMESPMDVAKAGRDRSRPIRKDWDQVRDQLMLDCCLAKFSQDAKFRALLDSTGDQILVEHTKNDNYWGDGGDGSGKNMLGITLMEVRKILREQAKQKK